MENLKPQNSNHKFPRRAGFSLLEFEVALILLGVALTGLFPLVAIYSKGVTALEGRLPVQGTWYVVPSSDAWARKLGAAAQVTTVAPAAPAPPPVLLVDDGDPAYSETGSGWKSKTNSGAYQGHYRLHASVSKAKSASKSDTANWQFSGVPAGWYQVEATWLPAAGDSATAAYAISDGTVSLGTFTANQQLTPSGPVFNGSPWQILLTELINGPDVQVELDAQNGGAVAASAVQLVPLQNIVQVQSLARSLDNTTVTAQVQVQVLVPQ